MLENKQNQIEKNAESLVEKSEKDFSAPARRGRGRPPKSQSDKENGLVRNDEFNNNKNQLSVIKKYFKEHENDCTYAGIGRLLGYSCAMEFIQDAKKKKGNLGYALSMVEERYEKDLTSKFSAGAIFGLKQVGWADTQILQAETKSVSVNVTLSTSLDELSSKLVPIMPEEVV